MEPTPPRRRRRAARRPSGPADPVLDVPDDRAVPPAPVAGPPVVPDGHRAEAHPQPAHPVPSPAPPHHPAGMPGAGGHPGRPSGDRRPGDSGGRRGRPAGPESSERSLRSLVTTRSTQVPSTAAMRAREVALPDAADLAEAEAELVIVRRHYVPPTSLPAGRRPDRRAGQGGQGGATRSGSDRDPG